MTSPLSTRTIPEQHDDAEVRRRILDAAFAAFMERGYSATSTLEIATRARVSKRELYGLIGNKQAVLIACISERARRLQMPADLPVAQTRDDLAHILVAFGTQVLREITDPAVVAAFRLAISEALHAPEVGRTVDSIGRETIRAALREIMGHARSSGLLEGRPADLAEQFGTLLWGNIMVGLLLGVAGRPTAREIAARAREATTTFLQLHPATRKRARIRRQD
jgi:AcrR family transcriptional regulator